MACLLGSASLVAAAPAEIPLTECRSMKTDFMKASKGWIAENSAQDTYSITSNGLEMRLVPPSQYVRLHDSNSNMPYNKYEGRGPTFNVSTLMRYGRFSATMRSAPVGGAITAFIVLADDGDEIDFEILGGDPHHLQTNFFYGKRPLYTVNGGLHEVPGEAVYDAFHTYTVDWRPERIEWLVDDKVIRTVQKKDTCDANECRYPSSPGRIQLGLWDGSFEAGTAEWSHGPIDWSQHHSISSYIKSVEVDCDPQYNKVIS
ncbi:concanavalin A-like lectin/glucanase domain-containing protein [Radiomyces spectabilis]|uniref:concanavalin A-like lectin/glucanase domain-containing protein n=1 Tax=Radiomyces spectabilis TaxID=64574 RepID=UPI00221EAB8A|nr:concanavalin A-like lectin/glucanase domain-containing protein [Radiomyces spectabilis]KAI8394130.1 concanavalin A-like lectin/glucanase domain-containing protein [Radiomyces spectabilis]